MLWTLHQLRKPSQCVPRRRERFVIGLEEHGLVRLRDERAAHVRSSSTSSMCVYLFETGNGQCRSISLGADKKNWRAFGIEGKFGDRGTDTEFCTFKNSVSVPLSPNFPSATRRRRARLRVLLLQGNRKYRSSSRRISFSLPRASGNEFLSRSALRIGRSAAAAGASVLREDMRQRLLCRNFCMSPLRSLAPHPRLQFPADLEL